MKKFLLHIVTPVVNMLVYLITWILVRIWSLILALCSGVALVPRDYIVHPKSALWTFICAVFGLVAVAKITGMMAPSWKMIHFYFVAIIIIVLSATSFVFSGLTLANISEVLGNIIGMVAGTFILLNHTEEDLSHL